jgi:hypothetical protein
MITNASTIPSDKKCEEKLLLCMRFHPLQDIADLEDLHCCSSSSNHCSSATNSSLLPPRASFPNWLKQHAAARHSSSQLQLLQLQQPPNVAPYTITATPAAAAAAAAGVAQGVECGGSSSNQVWLKPTSLDQLAALLHRHCGGKQRARLVAGNTGRHVRAAVVVCFSTGASSCCCMVSSGSCIFGIASPPLVRREIGSVKQYTLALWQENNKGASERRLLWGQ